MLQLARASANVPTGGKRPCAPLLSLAGRLRPAVTIQLRRSKVSPERTAVTCVTSLLQQDFVCNPSIEGGFRLSAFCSNENASPPSTQAPETKSHRRMSGSRAGRGLHRRFEGERGRSGNRRAAVFLAPPRDAGDRPGGGKASGRRTRVSSSLRADPEKPGAADLPRKTLKSPGVAGGNYAKPLPVVRRNKSATS